MTENTSPPRMPPEIAKAIIAVKRALAPAARSAQDDEGERQYASADDVYAACQKHMAEAGIFTEMESGDGSFEFIELISGEDGATRTSIHMTFWAVITHETGTCYANPRNRVDMVGTYEGMSTCAGLRTLAEKTYLRSLFKLPSAPGEAATGSVSGDGDARGAYSQTSPEDDAAPSGKRTEIKRPFQMNAQDSATARDAVIDALVTASETDGDNAAKIAAVVSAFRKAQTTWAKLRPVDQSQVRKEHAAITSKLANQTAA